MDFFKFGSGGSSSTGWKQAAEVNSTILMATSFVFILCLAGIVAKSGDFSRVWLFYGGDCDTAHVSEVNKALHLFLNLFSTAMVSFVPAACQLWIEFPRGLYIGLLTKVSPQDSRSLLIANLRQHSEFVREFYLL